jgi:hypothetical protein
VAFGAGGRMIEECGPMINVPVINMPAGFSIKPGILICTAATGERQERTRDQHCDDPVLVYLWHCLHLSLF